MVRLPDGDVTFAAAVRHLRADYGVRLLLCEGGPAVLGALIAEGLLDALFITLAPQLTGGGDGPPLSTGPELPELQGLRLAGLLERHGSLFLRYEVDRNG